MANRRTAFIGSSVLGMGFTLDPVDAQRLIEEDERNSDILFPYLSGRDLSGRPDIAASRWIINFYDWPEDRCKSYRYCYERVRRLVRPEREKVKRTVRRERWWQYAERAPNLYVALRKLRRAIAIPRISSIAMPALVPTGQIFSDNVVVFAVNDEAMFAFLSSAPHHWWAQSRASTLETRIRYTPSDVFETLPLPRLTAEMRALGSRLDRYRRELMLARQAGLTKTYNMVHDPTCMDTDIVELRQIHEMIDEAVCRAYGWDDLISQLDHGHHKTGRETRYTVGPAVQRELVDRLLELNHERYAAEVAAGLHDKKVRKGARGSTADQEGLFQTEASG